MKGLFFGLAILALVGCSDSDGGSGVATPTNVSSALSTAQSQIDALVPDTSGVSASSILTRASLQTEWTTGSNTYALGGDFGDSPRNYVRVHGDKTAQSSLSYRLNQIIQNLCLFTTAMDSTNGIPDITGPTTVTLSASLKAQLSSSCGVALDQLPADDTVVGYQVEDLSSDTTSEYERRASFDLSGGTSFNEFFHFTINSTVTRFSYLEDKTNKSVAFFEFTPATQTSRFEFSEFSSGNFDAHYRGILVNTTGVGRFVASVRNTTPDASLAVVSILEGQGSELHVSYAFDDDADTNDISDRNACINASTFAVAADDTLSCISGAITGAQTSDFTVDPTAANSAYISSRDQTSTVQFTDVDNLLTSSLAE